MVQVLGLWYILAITFGMSLLLTVIQNLRRPHRRQLLLNFLLCRKSRAVAAANAPSASGDVVSGGEEFEGAVCEVGVGLENRGKKGQARTAPALPGGAQS